MLKLCVAGLLVAAAMMAHNCVVATHEPFKVQFQWNYINYTWPSEEAWYKARKDESYIDRNNVISSVKLWKGKMYLTVPRYRAGVPVTLAVTSSDMLNGTTAPLLEPYPSWDMQKIGDCAAFQTVQNMEIDPKGRMWVLDSGRVATMTLESKASCPPRLVILDLENGGSVLRSYAFPKDVINYDSGILNDIVIDHEHGGMAYITDSDDVSPGLIVFSLENSTSWKVHHKSMNYVPDAVGFKIENINFADKVNIDGIALSPASSSEAAGGDGREVYFTPLSSFNVFVVKTQALVDAQNQEAGDERSREIDKHIRLLGRKPSQTDGMVMSNSGKLYFGLLADDAVSMWDSKATGSFVTGQRIISRDHKLMQWPDNFAFDDKGQLWCITNRMHVYINNSVDVSKANYRAIMSKVNMLNYQYLEDGTAPEWPVITAGAAATSSKDVAIPTLLAAVLVMMLAR